MPVPHKDLLAPADPARVVKVERPAALAIKPNHEFNFVLYPDHPGNWFVATIKGDDVPEEDRGTWVLPLLQREHARPGLRGNRTIPTGADPSHASSAALQRIRDDGGVVLLNAKHGFAVPVDARDPISKRSGIYWLSVWETPKPLIRGRRLEFAFDRVRYLRWLLALMRAGELPQPDPAVIRDHVERRQARVARREGIRDLDPKVRQAYVQEAKAELALFEQARAPGGGDQPVAAQP